MIRGQQDPVWDAQQFKRGWLQRPATLREMVNWAHHIHRSSPANYPQLLKWPPAKEAAKSLWRAYQNALPVERQLELATIFNDAMLTLRMMLDTPKSSKPTIGKPQDRFGEKQRRVEAKTAERVAKKQLRDAPAPSAYPAGSLFEGQL